MRRHAARAVRISEDGRTYTYLMRPDARFHDGSTLTAHMLHDKKMDAGTLPFVLMKGIT